VSGGATVWVVAGPPGAGKSSVAGALLAALRGLDPQHRAPALLDKDTLFGGLVGEVLALAGRPADEREGDWYDVHVKVHEYGAMTAAARQIRAAGCPVLLDAPFTGQIRDPDRWRDWVAELGGEPVRLVWVRTDAQTLRSRLVSRGQARDGAKLEAFDAFVDRMQPGVPPPVPHLEIDNRPASRPLADQLADALSPARLRRPLV
jgi:predicted kinase